MAAVLALQALHDFSDRETAEAVRFDVRWKAAIGAALDDPGFDPSTLVYWRRRLAASAGRTGSSTRCGGDRGDRGPAGPRRRAVDSTILDDAVATQDTVTQLVAAIRRAAREVPGAAAVIAASCTGHDYSKPGKPEVDWDDPAAKDALVSALVNDANAVLAASRARTWTRRRPRRWRCWRWSPGRTWSPPRAPTAGRPVADRPQGGRGPGHLHGGSRGPAHPQVPWPAVTATAPMWPPTRRPGSSLTRS